MFKFWIYSEEPTRFSDGNYSLPDKQYETTKEKPVMILKTQPEQLKEFTDKAKLKL